ncbi:hypothetical protein LCGC14_3141790, partial [marine sediment metagenome]
LELFDNNSNTVTMSYFLNNYTKGTSEFLWGTDNSSSYSYITFLEDQSSAIELAIIDGSFHYLEGSWQDIGVNALNNQIYSHKIVFDSISDTFDWYIEDTLRVSDGNFKSDSSHINILTIKTSSSHSNYSVYFDSIKFNAYIEHAFSGTTDISGNSWTFYFDEPLLTGIQSIKVIANDTLGYVTTLTGYDMFFDSTPLGFFPETLPSGYLFNGSNLIFIQNSTGPLFNKTIKSLHIYASSVYTDLGYYYNLPSDFNSLIIDSTRIPDGNHYLIFEFTDTADNTFKYNYSIIVDNNPPTITDLNINNIDLGKEIYFNDHVDLNLELEDFSTIASVKLYV